MKRGYYIIFKLKIQNLYNFYFTITMIPKMTDHAKGLLNEGLKFIKPEGSGDFKSGVFECTKDLPLCLAACCCMEFCFV